MGTGPASDHELAPIFALLFAASVARVIHAVLAGESFGVESTLALTCVVALPWLAWLERRK